MNFERFGLIVKGPAFRQESVTGRKIGGVIAQVSLTLAYQLRTARPREQDRYTVYR